MKQIISKAAIAFFILGLIITPALSQDDFPSQIWHKGNVYGTDGQGASGLIKYDLDNNLIQMKGEVIQTLTAANVSYFEIYDEIYGGVRKFYSLPYALNGNYEVPVFFEVLTEGEEIALLCREYIATDARNLNTMGGMGMNPFFGPQTMMGYRLAFNYFFFKNGRIERYSMKKRDLFTMLPGYEDEISLFMRKNRLEHDKRGDLLRITAYYNELDSN